ncbi:type VII secretion target [Mycobacterium sp. SMC-4]|uniref:type VII secretion target n=1 Tax=Mycobacterium sp. SMC-4 TaxID=2857059 RepID=UPI003CFF5216
MLVDPDLLRAFAAEVESAAAGLSGLDVGTTATAAADGLPGSSTQWATRQVGERLGRIAADLISDISAIGDAVRGAGDRYEVTDESLAGQFTKLF